MTSEAAAGESATRPPNQAYNLFILFLTGFSLVIMVALFLPLSDATLQLLAVFDNIICAVFLGDFVVHFVRAPSKRTYFVDEQGWLDLVGSVPNLGLFKYMGLLRLARLPRAARISRLFRTSRRRRLIADILANRANYAAFLTLLLAFIVLSVASTVVLQLESTQPDANITTGADAVWWAVVTITTVGYGDRYPVSLSGRWVAMLVMFAGVGIIGALASILASVLVPPAPDGAALGSTAMREEIAALRRELAELRQELRQP